MTKNYLLSNVNSGKLRSSDVEVKKKGFELISQVISKPVTKVKFAHL